MRVAGVCPYLCGVLAHPRFRIAYKALALALVLYTVLAGLLKPVPDIGIGQSARNLFFHVPMWFSMYLLMGLSVLWSLVYLKNGKPETDRRAAEAATVGVAFGLMGLVTGMIWSRVTWNQAIPATDPAAWWGWDPKQTGALLAVLLYLAYFLLRSSVERPRQRARLAAVYNVFAAASLLPLSLILPRMLGGLHPGADGQTELFGKGDVSDAYRAVFYPAILAWMLLGLWVLELRIRLRRLEARQEDASFA